MTARIEPWGPLDHVLLRQCLADPAMTEHIGGPERETKIAERQARYEQPGSHQYRIVDDSGVGAGWVGYWERDWDGHAVYETGWAVIPAFQGRGFASGGMRALLPIAAADGARRFMHAYPSVDNIPSNAVCATLGFTLRGPVDFEYPKGRPMRVNDWRLDLSGLSPRSS